MKTGTSIYPAHLRRFFVSYPKITSSFVARYKAKPGYMLHYTIEGAAEFRFREGKLISEEGSLVLIAPEVPHDYYTCTDPPLWHVMGVHFFARPHWLQWLRWPEVGHGVMQLQLADPAIRARVSERLTECWKLSYSSMSHREDLALSELEAALLWCDEANPLRRKKPLDARVRVALDYLNDHLFSAVTRHQLARAAGLSPSRLNHLFVQQVGESPLHYLHRQRVQQACNLLRLTDMPIGEIANNVGFEDALYFSRQFKRHTGQSPRAYRQDAAAHTE